MLPNNTNTQEFRQLRQRLFYLRNAVNEQQAVLRLASEQVVRTDALMSIQLHQAEIVEIEYVLDYFDRLQVIWTIQMRLLLAAIIVAVAVVAAIALLS